MKVSKIGIKKKGCNPLCSVSWMNRRTLQLQYGKGEIPNLHLRCGERDQMVICEVYNQFWSKGKFQID